MSPVVNRSLPTKREFGIGYVAGVGLTLAVGLFAYAMLAFDSLVLVAIVVGLALALGATTVYLAVVFQRLEADEEFVWTVAKWTAVGIGLATGLSLVIGFGHRYVSNAGLVAGVLVGTITVGGLLGTMLGVTAGLRRQHAHLSTLTQRNTVLNRVLRHNIKNDVNVILGHTTLLEEQVDESAARSVEAIEGAARSVTRLSQSARQIDRLDNEHRKPVDVAETAAAAVDSARYTYPDAEFETDLRGPAWVRAGPVLRPAISNLLENAVEHNDDEATVRVSVHSDEEVRLRVADDGPGIVEHEHEVLAAEQEGPIQHGSGLGLWLVKWFVEEHDGELQFATNEPHGTVVTLVLPATDPPGDTDA